MSRFRQVGMMIFALAAGIIPGVAQSTAPSQSATPAQSTAQPRSQQPQRATRSTELVVNGYDGQADVIYRNGHAYVEVEGLAQVTQSTLAFQGKSIVLTLPAATIQVTQQAAPASSPVPAEAPPEKGYSQEFLRAGVEEMTVIREWRSAIENAVRTNNPVEASWIAWYRSNAENRVAVTTASATTEADKQALPLLGNAMGMIQQLSDRFLALRSNLTFVATDSLDHDPLDQKILACAQGLAAQAIPGGQFQDVQACH